MARLMSVWKHPKFGTYYIREPVPPDLWGRAKRKTYKRSLGRHVSSRGEARSRYIDALAVFHAWIDSLRAGPIRLSAAQVEALVGLWYRRELESGSANPGAPEHWEAAGLALPSAGDQFEEDALRRLGDRLARALLADEGLEVDEETHTYLGARLVDRMHALYDRLHARAHGDFSPDPVLQQFPPWEFPVGPKPLAGLTFADLIARWRKSADISPKTQADYLRVVEKFSSFIGHDEPARVETADVERWRDSLLSSGLKTKTVQGKYLAGLSAVYRASQGRGRGRLQGNPVDGAWFRGRRFADSVEVRPYSPDELRALLLAARGDARPEHRWLPWLMAYTGLRFREATQCIAADVRERGGVWYVDVNADQAFKRLKGRPGAATPSRRDVPLHTHLIAEGFVTYAKSVPPDAFLFPRLKPRADGRSNEGRPVSELREWMKSHTVPHADVDRRLLNPTHSLRHAFEDLLRQATPDHELRRDIQGREDGSSARGYGDGHALLKKWAVIDAIPPLC